MALDKKNDTWNLILQHIYHEVWEEKAEYVYEDFLNDVKITGSHTRKLEVMVFPHCNDVQRITMFETA